MEPVNNQHCIRNTIYSVGLSEQPNYKKSLLSDNQLASAVNELEDYLADPDLESKPRVARFKACVRRKTNNPDIALSMINEGYILVLQRLASNAGLSILENAVKYAQIKGVSVPEALLFGFRGAAYYALVNHVIEDKIHGMHRPGRTVPQNISEQAREMWQQAYKNCSMPITSEGKVFQIADVQKHLPEGIQSKIKNLWRQNPAFFTYAGVNRLAGDTPYEIIEELTDTAAPKILNKKELHKYRRIIEKANITGINSFYALYCEFNKDRLESLWDLARKQIYDYSLKLWEKQSQNKLQEGSLTVPEGVTCRHTKSTGKRKKINKKKLPGTIYLNNKRYYWIVARKMKAVPLIDPASKPKFPGTIFKNGNRYYWFVKDYLKRQRLVPKGEKFSTNNRAVAEKLAVKKWKKLKKQNPSLAKEIITHSRSKGLATKDRKLAEKIALKMWKNIQKNKPKLAAKILTDNRPEPMDHWYAQLNAKGNPRHLGSFKTKKEAMKVYKEEFEKVYGYPPGYDVKVMPKIDKVWPTWQEQKQRLEKMHEYAKMPVIGDFGQIWTPLITKMQKIDWLINNCTLVFDKSSPIATEAIAVQSRGRSWYEKVKEDNQSVVIQGSASIDKNTNRIQLTVYQPGFNNTDVLIEEIYHTVFEIILHKNRQLFRKILNWYSNKLNNGLDPTYGIHEAFADEMVNIEKNKTTAELPENIAEYAKQIFSPNSNIPSRIFNKIRAGI